MILSFVILVFYILVTLLFFFIGVFHFQFLKVCGKMNNQYWSGYRINIANVFIFVPDCPLSLIMIHYGKFLQLTFSQKFWSQSWVWIWVHKYSLLLSSFKLSEICSSANTNYTLITITISSHGIILKVNSISF